MKLLFSFSTHIGLVSVLLSVLVSASQSFAELKTVEYVDLNSYVGDWYEIAHIPLFFEHGPCACTRQRLTPIANGVVQVYNSCNENDAQGKLVSISGEAYNDDTSTNSRFTVDFHLAFKGSYWIIGLDPQYRYAVVSDRNQYSLYILSRTSTLTGDLYDEAVALAKAQGLDTSKLSVTSQTACIYPR